MATICGRCAWLDDPARGERCPCRRPAAAPRCSCRGCAPAWHPHCTAEQCEPWMHRGRRRLARRPVRSLQAA